MWSRIISSNQMPMSNDRPIRAVLFDKDGTLVDFEATWAPINRKAALLAAAGDGGLAAHILQACGVDPDTGCTQAESPFAIAAADEIAAAMIMAGSPLEKTRLIAGLHQLFAEGGRAAKPLGDVHRVLDTLTQGGIACGIASSDSAEAVNETIHALGIAPYMRFACGYDSGFGPKPGPGMVQAFCAALQLQPHETAMVGDSTHDLHMGRTAGCGLVVGVLSGTGTSASLSGFADILLPSVADLPACLFASTASGNASQTPS
jgi:phosphoglycolate phosphatase